MNSSNKLMSQLYTLNPTDLFYMYVYISYCGTKFKILKYRIEIYNYKFFVLYFL